MNTLRDAFEAEAGRAEFSPDALPAIRARVQQRSRRRRRLAIGLGSLATAAAAAVVVVAVAVGTSTPTLPSPTPPAGGPSTVAPPPTPSPAPGGFSVTVPVYFTATVDGRNVLYREFRTVTIAEDDLRERLISALELSLTGQALDPDYGTRWPAGSSIMVLANETSLDISLLIAHVSATMGDDQLALQQLVWTATAVLADTGFPPRAVRFRVEGNDLGNVTRAPAAETLAPVWVISPQQDAVVGRSFTVQLAGVLFEATGRLRVRDSAGNPVSDEMFTLSIGAPSQGTVSVPMTLPPGQYTIEAYYISAVEGVGERAIDSHSITVR